MICFALGLTVQAGAYLYMDRVLFAPLASGDYDMSDVKDKVAEAAEKEGKKTFQGKRQGESVLFLRLQVHG